jgi:putative transposase
MILLSIPKITSGIQILHLELTVSTATFNVLNGFVVLLHNRRHVVHFKVTTHPTALWTAQQIVEAFPEETAPRFLQRDRDQIYGEYFRCRVAGMGFEEVVTAARSPWQNPYAERMIGSIRRECLDHLVVLNERQLRRILSEYIAYYNKVRPHQSLDGNPPEPREVEPPARGKIISCRYEHCVAKTKAAGATSSDPLPEAGSAQWTLFANCSTRPRWR